MLMRFIHREESGLKKEHTYVEFISTVRSESLKLERVQNTYRIEDEKKGSVCTSILAHYYGSLWEATLDRLDHQMDGYLYTIYHQGQKYRVYRNLYSDHPKLRLVSNNTA